MILRGDRLILGTCYYPEHWPETMWRGDLKRMKDTGIEVIRIAEFAWNKIEPKEGKFNYDFFDRFLDVAEEENVKVIMGTPTATPPAWLTEKYPETLNADKDGNLFYHGARRHYNYNSPVYQELSARIVEKMAEHYGKRPCIIGWQIDNEVNCENDEFYSESDHQAFRKFVQDKYGSLETLNEAWGTVFWNQTYTDWKEIHAPRKTCSDSTNPHEVLDYFRFVSYSARSFVKRQSDIIKKYKKQEDFITTNGLFGNLDSHRMTRESLDFITYDSYPNFAYCLDGYSDKPGNMKDRKWSRNLSMTRSISPVFGIMEQQSGANGWNTRMEAPTPRPGQITLWTMQSVAHGADYISYFRWRTCTVGTEIYWHGILDYSGRDNRRIREIREIHKKFEKMKKIAGSYYEAKVGVIKDYDNTWDSQLDVWHGRLEKQSQKAFFEAAQLTHTPFDYVNLDETVTEDDLKGYKVLFYPHGAIMTQEQTEVLRKYVENGGVLVLGCRNAYKNINGKCVMENLPGVLADLAGVDIPEYTAIAPDAGKVIVNWEGTEMEAAVFAEQLDTLDHTSEIVGTYGSDYYKGTGALTRKAVGKGKVYYYGSAYTADSVRVFLEKLDVIEPYGNLVEVPETCEIAMRTKNEKKYLFILNYEKKPASVKFLKPMKDLWTDNTLIGEVELEPYGVLVAEVL